MNQEQPLSTAASPAGEVRPAILILYTGGTIGMTQNPETGALENFDWPCFQQQVPELARFHVNIDAVSFKPAIDSSDMEPRHWVKMVQTIADNYDRYDGFVILHGTDTMAYTASALSFMLENLGKPVIVTGSQLPIGQLRTDGKENLLTSVEIAAARRPDGTPMVPEVCIFFENKLMRGNRTTKINAEGFNAFRSYNYPALANVGIHIRYAEHHIRRPAPGATFRPHFLLSDRVVVLSLFPGIRRDYVAGVLSLAGVRGVILKTYGSGNAPQKPWLIELLTEAIARGIIVVNVTQCSEGSVEMHRYGTGLQLLQAGVVNGYDATVECMVTKLMFILGHDFSRERLAALMDTSIAGEITRIPE